MSTSPKSNGYRALHTTVMGPKNKKIEIQFRSNAMDQIADYGVAAHWKYKDPKSINEKDRAGWVCGLGHGILKDTPEENVHYFIETIRKIFS